MPDNDSSKPVKQDGTEPVEPVEATNTNSPPQIPDSHPAQPVTNEAMEGQIEDIQDRVKRGEWWMIGLTAAIALFALCSICVGLLQWSVMKGQLKEMHDGGTDTHNLATAAGKQATWTQNLATNMQTQADRTKDLADRMKDQADQTKEIARQAIIQAKAAKSTAETAHETLSLSERAYLLLGSPMDDFANGRTIIPIYNSGHIPSGRATVTVHEATFKVKSPQNTSFVPASAAIEAHWQTVSYESVPVLPTGGIYSILVHLPKIVPADIQAGKQSLAIAAVLSYNEGFPNTPAQEWTFCDQSTFDADKKLLTMAPCGNPDGVLAVLMSLDKYPDHAYEK
jgi:hypothetical protein